MPEQQLTIPDTPRPRQPHGNRGQTLQRMIDRAHVIYARIGLGRMVRNPNEWAYCSERQLADLPRELTARTGHGRAMRMTRSDVDYSGGMEGRHVEFDAKEFAGPSISLTAFKSHQVDKLCESARGGNLAGFVVYSTDTGEAFWVEPVAVREAQDRVLFQPKGKGRFPKSFNLAHLREHSVWLGVFRPASALDYWPTLHAAKRAA